MYILVATVQFNRSTYTTSESDGTVQLVLVLSTSIAVDVTVLVKANDITATGQLSNISYIIDTSITLQEVMIIIPHHSMSPFLLE